MYEVPTEDLLYYRKCAAKFAKRYYRTFGLNTTMDFEDLIQEGMVGLMDAVSRYDDIDPDSKDREKRLRSYAVTRIIGQIIGFIRKEFPHLVQTHPIGEDDGEWKVEEPYDYSPELLEMERVEEVDALTKDLDDGEKLILYLLYYENYTIREVASIIDKSHGKVHVMKTEALERALKAANGKSRDFVDPD
jgi:RNA polymerase sigma factor (sigma-70 family)